MREEPREHLIERGRLLEIGKMAGVRNDFELRSTDRLRHRFAECGRRDGIGLADDDQRRTMNAAEERRRIGSRHERVQRA